MPRKPVCHHAGRRRGEGTGRHRAQISSPYCDVIRAKVVLLAADGFSNKEIGAVSTSRGRLFRNGANASLRSDWPGFRDGQDADARVFFSPDIVMQVKALACQLPKDLGLPFSRLTVFLR